MLVSRRPRNSRIRCEEKRPEPYCRCWSQRTPLKWDQLKQCSCGEDVEVREWKWQPPDPAFTGEILMSDDRSQVTFYPTFSTGTAAVKGDTPLLKNYHYYWEVKILTDTYGTDTMVGVGSEKLNVDPVLNFTSLLGSDGESYGISYKGEARHGGTTLRDADVVGFCRGSIVGVRLDLWQGTLDFCLNRKPLGVTFYNLRRHATLYPMLCSTAAQSTFRLIYTASKRASLLVDAAKTLAAAVREKEQSRRLPPGLWYAMKSEFWLTLPVKGRLVDDDERKCSEGMDVDPLILPSAALERCSLSSKFRNGQPARLSHQTNRRSYVTN